ncbi:hypothetical protein [Nitrospirillum sp. BR 11828]|uniref:hypothetical protein n=1 Tax=Nitrospirillum sp. BR 11828 TaxID=3104325 RepID=UPI002ACA52F5|nr:hypothetical protein [Nitrospirillum sp. BR 11828]MDZ5649748.1 hypothetical protein [Nitrospirillum sp. BR 11828]
MASACASFRPSHAPEAVPHNFKKGAFLLPIFIDPFRVFTFLHVVLFAYWLGTDLGVLITGMAANAADLTGNARERIRKASGRIDMGPRTAMVLMVPVGLTLASNWGLPIGPLALVAAWVGGLAWLWLVWMIYLRQGTRLGKRLWKIDLGIRMLATIGFVGTGIVSLATGAPVDSGWLATKMLLFGLLLLLGVVVRLLLLWKPPVPPKAGAPFVPAPFWNPLRITVFAIWALVLAMAFLGVTKPF